MGMLILRRRIPMRCLDQSIQGEEAFEAWSGRRPGYFGQGMSCCADSDTGISGFFCAAGAGD